MTLLYGIVAALAGGFWFLIALRFLDEGDTSHILGYGFFILLGPIISLIAGFTALSKH